MLYRPDAGDYRVIGQYVGRVLIGVGLLMLVPAALGLVMREFDAAVGFVIGFSLTLTAGLLLTWRMQTQRHPDWSHGVVISALSWLVGPFFGAVPLFLSGHFGSFLDAYFDGMSGFATAGLTVINDLDHVAYSVNLWRHLLQYVGGQGLVLVVLTLFAAHGATAMYVGEAREERILPNIIGTARFIVRVSLLWLALATPLLWLALVLAGYDPGRALLHAIDLFMAAFSTGGFAPRSASVAFYHSALLEGLLAVIMIAGASSFGIHYLLINRRFEALRRHLEVRTFLVCLLVFYTLAAIALARTGAYTSADQLFRRGFFMMLSAQTTTGFATLPSRTLVSYWGALAPAMIVGAMTIGAMSGSTGGGIKVARIGVIAKSLKQDVLRRLLPPDAVVVESYHAGQPRILRPEVVRLAAMVLLLFMLLYGMGALIGMFYEYPFDQAFFESVSAAGTVGLSVGLTGPSLETGLKIVYITQIWMGRLELIAVLALFGFAYSTVRGRL